MRLLEAQLTSGDAREKYLGEVVQATLAGSEDGSTSGRNCFLYWEPLKLDLLMCMQSLVGSSRALCWESTSQQATMVRHHIPI